MADPAITPQQIDAICHAFTVLDWSPDQTAPWLQAGWGVPRVRLLSAPQAAAVEQALIGEISAWVAADVAEADFAALGTVDRPDAPVTADQVADLDRLRRGAGMSALHYRNWLLKHWNVEQARQLTQAQYQGARQLLTRRQLTAAGAKGAA